MEYVSNINGYLSLAFMVGFLFLSFYGTLHYLADDSRWPIRFMDRIGYDAHAYLLHYMAIFFITHVVLFYFVYGPLQAKPGILLIIPRNHLDDDSYNKMAYLVYTEHRWNGSSLRTTVYRTFW